MTGEFLSVSPAEAAVFVGQSLTLSCDTDAGDQYWALNTGSGVGLIAIPSADWPAADDKHEPGTRRYELTITSATHRYAGEYFCVADGKTASTSVAVIGIYYCLVDQCKNF